MAGEGSWEPQKHGWFTWRVQKRMWADSLGSAYKFHKRKGLTQMFWSREKAQQRANELNQGEG